jgi:putative transposase
MGCRSVAGMLKLERSIVSRLVCRFRGRAVVELENLALRYQLHVLRRQRPGRLRLFAFDRLLWVLLYRLWPRCLEVMVLVKPTTVIHWAPSRLPPVLAMAVAIRAAVSGSRDS